MYSGRVGLQAKLLQPLVSSLATRSSHQMVPAKNESCKYPQIVDMNPEGFARHHRQVWYDHIKALPTVEEKLHELALQQRPDVKTYMLPCVPHTYVAVPFYPYVTRTHVVQGLPQKLLAMDVSKELDDIYESLERVLYNHFFNAWEKNGGSKTLSQFVTEEDCGVKLMNSLLSQCFKRLAPKNQYIMESSIQLKPRICSVWWHGGYGSEDSEIHERNPCLQFNDVPGFTIRMKRPLDPILKQDDNLCISADVPSYHFHPDVLGIQSKEKFNLLSIPGYWPGDPCGFPLLLVNSYEKIEAFKLRIDKYSSTKIENSVAVMSSFGWLNALAAYQGFTPFHDLTYPLVTNTVITNGQDFRFFVYQLNTVAFHSDLDERSRRNICWASPKMRLFEKLQDGKVLGINPEVFGTVLRMLLNAPVEDAADLRPYLGEDNRTEEEISNLRMVGRKMCSQVPDHMAHLEEVPTWQKIYKFHKDAPPSPFVRME